MSCLENDPYYVNSPVMNLSVRYFLLVLFFIQLNYCLLFRNDRKLRSY